MTFENFTESVNNYLCCNCNISTGSPLSNTDFQWSPATYTHPKKHITYTVYTENIYNNMRIQQKMYTRDN